MESAKPEMVSTVLERLFAAGDLDGVMELYEDGAVFVEIDGVSRGKAEIRAAHRRFLDSGMTLRLKDSVAFEAGDLALVHWSWTVAAADGWTAEGASAEVMRRGRDGRWRFVIDNSDGAAMIGLF